MLVCRVLAVSLTALAFSSAASFVRADIPAPHPPEAPREVEAPLKLTIDDAAQAEAMLVIPRQFVEAAGFADPRPAPTKSNSLPAILGTIAGGGALSLGVLLLGVYFLRRSQRRARAAVAGTVASAILIAGSGIVLANAPPAPPLPRESAPVTIDSDLPNVKIAIVDQGDAIELILPKTLVQAKTP